MRQIYKAGAILMALLILGGCTTQKRRGDLSGLGKLYHNTTAKYNGYFNAKELLKESEAQLAAQHQDNYNMMLKMFPAVAADNPQAVAGNLDEAIKKVTVVVNLHRESHWTDDAYLLVGQAQYLKQDYEAAEETLRFMTDEFSPQKMAKASAKASKKKKGKKAKSSSSSDRTARADADDEKPQLTKKQQAKERKRYNREVQKKRKQANRNRGKKKSASRKKKADDKSQEQPTETVQPVTEPAVEEETKITSISISDNDTPINADPDGYFMKHRPAYQEGVLWLARTLIERDNYDGALRLLGQLERDPGTFDEVRSDLSATQAYYHIKRKEYAQALPHLQKAVEMEEDNTIQARFTYIMAQIHQHEGNSKEAYAAFEQVLKYNPPYEMAFSSRLSLAQNSYLAGIGSSEEAKRNLEKLLKDPKNQEFLDQIYFALAEIAFKENNREEAIKNLSLSLQNGRSNGAQKAEAYLKLGRLFYEDENYIAAKAYLDSTLQVLPSTDERYGEVQTLSNNLTDIAANLATITLQDSLLKIAALSDEDKKALAYQIKQEQDEARRKALAAKANTPAANDPKNPARLASLRSDGPATSGALQKESSFFAYNDRALKRGQRSFAQEWGDRQLEDNWRRASRRDAGGFAQEEVKQAIVESVIDEGDIDQYLGDYPKSENDIQQAHLKVREAMYALGSLYRERLNNLPRSVEVLDQLNARYPASNYELDSWYVLYLDHKDLNNNTQAQAYYDKIIDKYPGTNYAKILKDPNYASQYLDEERKLNVEYDQTYQLFANGNYQQAFNRSEQALKALYGKHPLKPKYALLMAMCVGNLQGKEAYINDLQRVVALYPETDEQRRAKEILRMLGGAGANLPGQVAEEDSQFKYEPEDLHYVLIVFNQDVNLENAKVSISDYNRKFHDLDKLRISNIYLGTDNKTPVLVMRRYKDQAAAMRYFEGVKKNTAQFLDAKTNYSIYPITQGNYRQVLKNKTVDGYQAFFESNYLQ